MNKTLKRYLLSSLVTFLAGFLSIVLVNIDNITLDSFRDGTLVGILFIAVRTGIKGLIEWFLATFIK
jgi:O-antigen/teichoic acid export membrane protein